MQQSSTEANNNIPLPLSSFNDGNSPRKVERTVLATLLNERQREKECNNYESTTQEGFECLHIDSSPLMQIRHPRLSKEGGCVCQQKKEDHSCDTICERLPVKRQRYV